MRSEMMVGFQATRKPTGMGDGTRIGVSTGSSAEAARLRARARAKARMRTWPNISAVRASRADCVEHGARNDVREIGAGVEGGADLGGGSGKYAPRDLDDAGELLDAIEALPLR